MIYSEHDANFHALDKQVVELFQVVSLTLNAPDICCRKLTLVIMFCFAAEPGSCYFRLDKVKKPYLEWPQASRPFRRRTI